MGKVGQALAQLGPVGGEVNLFVSRVAEKHKANANYVCNAVSPPSASPLMITTCRLV